VRSFVALAVSSTNTSADRNNLVQEIALPLGATCGGFRGESAERT
jgi:hypothetical protein